MGCRTSRGLPRKSLRQAVLLSLKKEHFKSFIYALYYKISILKFLSPTGLLPFAPRRTISPVDQDSDDTVYVMGCSPDNDFLKRIVRLSLNTLEEETVIEIPNTMSCGMARIDSRFEVFDIFSIIHNPSFKRDYAHFCKP